MTLIVAGVTDEIGFMVADTLLSPEIDRHEGPVNGEFHALKVQILDPHTAVAFASNDADACLKIIGRLYTELNTHAGLDVCEFILRTYRQACNGDGPSQVLDCEFLVLQITSQGRRLAKISKNGIVHQGRAYIGDSAEYQYLMDHFRQPYIPPKVQDVQQPDGTFRTDPLRLSPGEIEFAEISDAMERLTSARMSKSVGAIAGCVIRVVDARVSGDLEYLQLAESSISPFEGKSGFSLLASNSGVRGVAIYYRSGRMGFIFVVGDTETCRKEIAETLDKFVELAAQKYGLRLQGGTWSN